MIILDTLAKSMAGEENSNTDMGKVQRVAAAIQHALDCTVIFVHHMGKGGDKDGRGASTLPAGLDFQVHIAGDNTLTAATVNVVKQKDAPRETEIYLQGRRVAGSLAFSRVYEKPKNSKDQTTVWYRDELARIIEDAPAEG